MQIFNQETELEDSTLETRLFKKTYLVGKGKEIKQPAKASPHFFCTFFFSPTVHSHTKYLHQNERKHAEV